MNIQEEVRGEIDRLGQIVPWYHRFELPAGLVIPGWEGVYPIWEMIRAVRAPLAYAGARVLDLGSRDGMWAFEAEKLGASSVVATDIGCDGYREHLSFIKALTGSRVGAYFNVPAEDAFRRLDCFFQFNPGPFDVVQHLGLFYHLESPMQSLREARKCLKPGGMLLLETAFYRGGDETPLALFNSKSGVYQDPNTFWAFNWPALHDAINSCGFTVDGDSVRTLPQTDTIGRVCLLARANIV